MNQMVLYSKVVTIRDKQLEENKRLEHEWIEEQKKLDLMMEIERLKVLGGRGERKEKGRGQKEGRPGHCRSNPRQDHSEDEGARD